MSTLRAVVREGKIELLEQVPLPDGARVLVTILTDEDPSFWQGASEQSLKHIWENAEDDIYAELLTP